MDDATREVKMAEEEKLFTIINACCTRIVELSGHDIEVRYLIGKKKELLPNNYPEVINRCREILTGKDLKMVEQLKAALDASVTMVCERYMSWALVQGVKIGSQLGVDEIESKSGAMMGVHRAAFTYKPGNGFANYAPFWIRQTIQKSIDKRQITTVDSPAGDEDSNESMKDKIPASRAFSPTAVIEDHQMSEVFQRMVHKLPEEEKAEVEAWWYNDADVTPTVRRFAKHMHMSVQ